MKLLPLITELHNMVSDLTKAQDTRRILARKIHRAGAAPVELTIEEVALVSDLLLLWKLIRVIT